MLSFRPFQKEKVLNGHGSPRPVLRVGGRGDARGHHLIRHQRREACMVKILPLCKGIKMSATGPSKPSGQRALMPRHWAWKCTSATSKLYKLFPACAHSPPVWLSNFQRGGVGIETVKVETQPSAYSFNRPDIFARPNISPRRPARDRDRSRQRHFQPRGLGWRRYCFHQFRQVGSSSRSRRPNLVPCKPDSLR